MEVDHRSQECPWHDGQVGQKLFKEKAPVTLLPVADADRSPYGDEQCQRIGCRCEVAIPVGESYVLVPCQPHQEKGNIGQYEKERHTVYGQEAKFLQPENPVEIKGEIGYDDKSGGIDDDVLEVEGHSISGIGKQSVCDIKPNEEYQQDDVTQPCPVMGSLEVEGALRTKSDQSNDDGQQGDRVHLCTAYVHVNSFFRFEVSEMTCLGTGCTVA
ncbi:hypothetical protein [Sphingobacterium sp. JB170]|uniref:hypothetical protein n=1 Tax=Sphingobacterium sp. JB170 TaxID=1434842 RepID=UPI001C4E3626|nr:hypothetical protein [Sphingobacterium sp. JB170]